MPPMSRRTPFGAGRSSPPRWPWASPPAPSRAGWRPSGPNRRRTPPSAMPTSPPDTDPPDTDPPDTEPPETDARAIRQPSTSESSGELQWSEFSEGVETALLEVPVDYENPDGPTFELFVARRLADDQENKIGSLLVNPGGPGLRWVRLRDLRRPDLRGGAARAVRHRRLGPAGHRPERTGHRLHRRLRPLLRRHRHHPGRRGREAGDRRPRRGVRRQLRREQRRLLRVRRHEQQRPRHRLDPPGPRRGADQLLRVQLRQRARRHVGDAVPRDGARRRPRRGRRPERRPGRGRPAAGRRLRGDARRRTSPSAATTPRARSTTTATPRARSTP